MCKRNYYILSILTAIFLVVVPLRSSAIELPRMSFMQVKLSSGNAFAHHKEMTHLVGNPHAAVNLELGRITSGEEAWQKSFRSPSYGGGLYFADLATSSLGNPFALYGFADIPIFRLENSSFNYEIATGLAFNFNSFDEKNNPDNIAIGSNTNLYFNFNLNYKYALSKNSELVAAAGLTHFSNGSITMPNLGLNLYDFSLSWRYKLPEGRGAFTRAEKSKTGRYAPDVSIVGNNVEQDRHIFMLNVNGGIREQTCSRGVKYGIASLSGVYAYELNPSHRLGVSTDFFYDASKICLHDDRVITSLMEQGFAAYHEAIFGKIGVVSQAGIIAFGNDVTSRDYYFRIGLRYYANDRIFANVSFKGWNFTADFVEWGIGIVL